MAALAIPDLDNASRGQLINALRQAVGHLRRADKVAKENDLMQIQLWAAAERVLGGCIVGPGVAAFTAFVMNRWVNRDGSPLSIGPIPLPLAMAAPFVVASIFPWKGATQCSYIATGQIALTFGQFAAAAGIKARLKAAQAKAAKGGGTQTAGVGDDAGGLEALRRRYHQPPVLLEGNALESAGAHVGAVDIVDSSEVSLSEGGSSQGAPELVGEWSDEELALLNAA